MGNRAVKARMAGGAGSLLRNRFGGGARFLHVTRRFVQPPERGVEVGANLLNRTSSEEPRDASDDWPRRWASAFPRRPSPLSCSRWSADSSSRTGQRLLSSRWCSAGSSPFSLYPSWWKPHWPDAACGPSREAMLRARVRDEAGPGRVQNDITTEYQEVAILPDEH